MPICRTALPAHRGNQYLRSPGHRCRLDHNNGQHDDHNFANHHDPGDYHNINNETGGSYGAAWESPIQSPLVVKRVLTGPVEVVVISYTITDSGGEFTLSPITLALTCWGFLAGSEARAFARVAFVDRTATNGIGVQVENIVGPVWTPLTEAVAIRDSVEFPFKGGDWEIMVVFHDGQETYEVTHTSESVIVTDILAAPGQIS